MVSCLYGRSRVFLPFHFSLWPFAYFMEGGTQNQYENYSTWRDRNKRLAEIGIKYGMMCTDEGDVLKIILDCENSKLTFVKNELIYVGCDGFSIEKDKTYFPCFALSNGICEFQVV